MSSEAIRGYEDGDAVGFNNNEAKRARLDIALPNPPSRVVHMRNIPNEVSEDEVVQLGIPFGKVTNVLVLKGKNQAFLEMENKDAANQLVSYFTCCSCTLRERSVYVQFSKHPQLKTNQTHSNSSPSAQAALQAAQALTDDSKPASSGKSAKGGGPNTILRVVVDQMVYPVTLDVMHLIFSRVGQVLKIVTFTKNNTFQALVQFPDVVTAQAAKLSLDGQCVYNECCTLRIDYSNLSNLNVRYNNDKSRDYTNANLPRGDLLAPTSILGSQFLAVAKLFPFATALPVLPAQHADATGQAAVVARPEKAAAAQGGKGSKGGGVLIVSNLNEELTKCDHLFTLFGVYGDVMRIKILFNKKDTALVQMFEAAQAAVAMVHLDKIKLWDHEIQVRPSKHSRVKLPKEGHQKGGLTKDYTTSSLHRFKKPGSKNFANIYPPSATLHLSNIPPTSDDSMLKTAFEAEGLKVLSFKYFPKDRKMALAQLPSVEDAVIALIKMHNYRLSDTNHLRVSFSKSSI